MFVILVPFSKEHKNMLGLCKQMLEHNNGTVAIHPGNVTILILYYIRGSYSLSSTLTPIPLVVLHSLFLSLVLF